MIGRSAADFIHPDDLESARAAKCARAARRHEPGSPIPAFIHKDGRAVSLSWLGTWSEPVKRLFFVGRDMTESRLAQQTLRESEQLARGIIETALDAFVQMDESGAITDWNTQAEKIFGWPRDEAIGKKLGDLIVPGVSPRRASRRPRAFPAHRRRQDSRAAASRSRRCGATARSSRSSSASPR